MQRAQAGEVVVNPVKLLREARVARQLLDELNRGPLGDEAARRRFRLSIRQLLVEVGSSLSEEATAELACFVQLPRGTAPSDDELRVVQAQIVGWLDGLLESPRGGSDDRGLVALPVPVP